VRYRPARSRRNRPARRRGGCGGPAAIAAIRWRLVGQLDAGPVVQPAAFGAVAGAGPHPVFGRHRRGQLGGAHLRRPVTDRQQLAGLDGQHMGHPAALQPAPQRRVLAVDLIGGHPGSRHAGRQGPLQHALGQLRLGLEPDLVRHPGGPTPRPIVGPCLGQVSGVKG
jgi:hypothetical protein